MLKSLLFSLLVSAVSIVPQPKSVNTGSGVFSASKAEVYCDRGFDEQSRKLAAGYFLNGNAGNLKQFDSQSDGIFIIKDDSLADEAYKIKITPSALTISASGRKGILYSIQTLKQLDIHFKMFPCCEIQDEPRYGYRGLLLDCSRHFFSVEEVKKVLDVMSLYKLNRFQWHLTDDQGWRIEIKKYPKLTEVGAWRDGTMYGIDKQSNDGVRYGGFYTQDQLREVVAYADSLGITVVPEIDLPGHMQAALASYPEFGCKGSEPLPYTVWCKWGISRQVLNVGNEKVMKFLEDVLSEVCDIFPSELIAIGGDECPKDEWKNDPDCQKKIKQLRLASDEKSSAEEKLQSYVVARLQKHIAKRGRRLSGWEEIMEGDLQAGPVILGWRGTAGGARAAAAGYETIMCPWSFCYLNYPQSYDVYAEPFSYGAFNGKALTMDMVYSYEPETVVPVEGRKNVIGVQGQLWSECIETDDALEYMLLPRLLALSEVQWCQKGTRDFNAFKKKLQDKQFPILEKMGYCFREKSIFDKTLKEDWMHYLEAPDYYVFEKSVKLLKKYSFAECDAELYVQANGPGTSQRVLKVFPKNMKESVPTVVVPFYFPEGMLGFELENPEQTLEFYKGIDFMLQLARKGIATISADSYHLTFTPSERERGDFKRWQEAGADLIKKYPFWTGMGKLVFDTRLLIDLVEEDSRMDNEHIGIAGHSLGGKMAFYTGCLDDRIKVIVASDFGLRWEDSNWEKVWYWGNKLTGFKGRGYENSMLIRVSDEKPLCIIAGQYDNEKSLKVIRSYRYYEAEPDKFLFINHASGHRPPQWTLDKAFDWMEKYL